MTRHTRQAATWLLAAVATLGGAQKTCNVAKSSSGGDDAPAIVQAFSDCNNGGKVVFANVTYNVNTIMNTTGLKNMEIDLSGTLLWSTNITYWLANSLSTGYQNQSSAWFFGGDNITFRGSGVGTLDGNGQVWYDFVNGQSNYPRRPHAITIWGATNSLFDGLRFVQSQMWTMSIMHSSHVTLSNIYVNSTSHSGAPARNTDGADTIFSDDIHFDKWIVDNGDDSIALKANSTNILITNSTFYRGLGVAIGSIGQYQGVYETIQNLTATGITCRGTRNAAYVKTWTGQHVGDPPNGGGGGLGFASNLTFTDFTLVNNSGIFAIGQCTTFSGTAGDCNTSLFNLHNIAFTNVQGTASTLTVAALQCSAASPCHDITVSGIDISVLSGSTVTGKASKYTCSNVVNPIGFTCPGSTTTSSASSTSTSGTAATAATAATTSVGATSPKYGQCGGTGWAGPTACASGATCTYSNPYYSQCL